MVDFQSRDTRRGHQADEGTDQAEAGAEATPETDTEEAGPDAPAEGVRYAVVSVCEEPAVEADEAGTAVVETLEGGDGAVTTRELVTPDFDGVQSVVDALVDRTDVDVIVTVGGVGVGPDDVTVDAVEPLIDRGLPGFGELFRLLAHDEVGSEVVTIRATAGLLDSVPVFCLPGEVWAADLGTEGIIRPEAERIVDRTRG